MSYLSKIAKKEIGDTGCHVNVRMDFRQNSPTPGKSEIKVSIGYEAKPGGWETVSKLEADELGKKAASQIKIPHEQFRTDLSVALSTELVKAFTYNGESVKLSANKNNPDSFTLAFDTVPIPARLPEAYLAGVDHPTPEQVGAAMVQDAVDRVIKKSARVIAEVEKKERTLLSGAERTT